MGMVLYCSLDRCKEYNETRSFPELAFTGGRADRDAAPGGAGSFVGACQGDAAGAALELGGDLGGLEPVVDRDVLLVSGGHKGHPACAAALGVEALNLSAGERVRGTSHDGQQSAQPTEGVSAPLPGNRNEVPRQLPAVVPRAGQRCSGLPDCGDEPTHT